MCDTGCKLRLEHLFTSGRRGASSLGLHSCIVHIYVHPARRDTTTLTPLSFPHTSVNPPPPPVRGLKFPAGKLARKLACPRFRKTVPFAKIRLFRIRYREITAYKETRDIYPVVNELAGRGVEFGDPPLDS